jgi:heme-degrading monooxygenase HmoA
MYAVLIEVDVVGVERRAGLVALREHVVPAITQLPGFRSGTWLTGNEQGRGLSLTLWDSEENARAMAERFGGKGGPDMPATVARCEVREVAATA